MTMWLQDCKATKSLKCWTTTKLGDLLSKSTFVASKKEKRTWNVIEPDVIVTDASEIPNVGDEVFFTDFNNKNHMGQVSRRKFEYPGPNREESTLRIFIIMDNDKAIG